MAANDTVRHEVMHQEWRPGVHTPEGGATVTTNRGETLLVVTGTVDPMEVARAICDEHNYARAAGLAWERRRHY